MIRFKHLIAIATFGVLTAGCKRGAEPGTDTAAQAAPKAGNSAQATNTVGAQVALSGCLEAGKGGATSYVLRNVRYEPRGAGDPHRNTTTSGPDGITEGSWVTLVATEDFKGQIGRRVAVTGVVTDDGGNTIGTAGSSGAAVNSGDRSQAATPEHHSDKVKKESGRIARESMANGTAADIRVAQLKDLGESCRDVGTHR